MPAYRGRGNKKRVKRLLWYISIFGWMEIDRFVKRVEYGI
jgi:hypothetical protein